MQTLVEILEAAQRLSDDERRQLMAKLQDTSREELTDQPRRNAMASWLELAGTFHSDFPDVSTDKYKHLADVYHNDQREQTRVLANGTSVRPATMREITRDD